MVVSLAKPKSVSFSTALGLLEVYRRFSGCENREDEVSRRGRAASAVPRAKRGSAPPGEHAAPYLHIPVRNVDRVQVLDGFPNALHYL